MKYLEGRMLTLKGTQRLRVENRGYWPIADAFSSRSECMISHNQAE